MSRGRIGSSIKRCTLPRSDANSFRAFTIPARCFRMFRHRWLMASALNAK